LIQNAAELLSFIVGYQQNQRMIPKLLATPSNSADPPIWVNLHRRPRAPYHRTNLGLTETKAKQINVKVGETGDDEMVSAIAEKLSPKMPSRPA